MDYAKIPFNFYPASTALSWSSSIVTYFIGLISHILLLDNTGTVTDDTPPVYHATPTIKPPSTPTQCIIESPLPTPPLWLCLLVVVIFMVLSGVRLFSRPKSNGTGTSTRPPLRRSSPQTATRARQEPSRLHQTLSSIPRGKAIRTLIYALILAHCIPTMIEGFLDLVVVMITGAFPATYTTSAIPAAIMSAIPKIKSSAVVYHLPISIVAGIVTVLVMLGPGLVRAWKNQKNVYLRAAQNQLNRDTETESDFCLEAETNLLPSSSSSIPTLAADDTSTQDMLPTSISVHSILTIPPNDQTHVKPLVPLAQVHTANTREREPEPELEPKSPRPRSPQPQKALLPFINHPLKDLDTQSEPPPPLTTCAFPSSASSSSISHTHSHSHSHSQETFDSGYMITLRVETAPGGDLLTGKSKALEEVKPGFVAEILWYARVKRWVDGQREYAYAYAVGDYDEEEEDKDKDKEKDKDKDKEGGLGEVLASSWSIDSLDVVSFRKKMGVSLSVKSDEQEGDKVEVELAQVEAEVEVSSGSSNSSSDNLINTNSDIDSQARNEDLAPAVATNIEPSHPSPHSPQFQLTSAFDPFTFGDLPFEGLDTQSESEEEGNEVEPEATNKDDDDWDGVEVEALAEIEADVDGSWSDDNHNHNHNHNDLINNADGSQPQNDHLPPLVVINAHAQTINAVDPPPHWHSPHDQHQHQFASNGFPFADFPPEGLDTQSEPPLPFPTNTNTTSSHSHSHSQTSESVSNSEEMETDSGYLITLKVASAPQLGKKRKCVCDPHPDPDFMGELFWYARVKRWVDSIDEEEGEEGEENQEGDEEEDGEEEEGKIQTSLSANSLDIVIFRKMVGVSFSVTSEESFEEEDGEDGDEVDEDEEVPDLNAKAHVDVNLDANTDDARLSFKDPLPESAGLEDGDGDGDGDGDEGEGKGEGKGEVKVEVDMEWVDGDVRGSPSGLNSEGVVDDGRGHEYGANPNQSIVDVSPGSILLEDCDWCWIFDSPSTLSASSLPPTVLPSSSTPSISDKDENGNDDLTTTTTTTSPPPSTCEAKIHAQGGPIEAFVTDPFCVISVVSADAITQEEDVFGPNAEIELPSSSSSSSSSSIHSSHSLSSQPLGTDATSSWKDIEDEREAMLLQLDDYEVSSSPAAYLDLATELEGLIMNHSEPLPSGPSTIISSLSFTILQAQLEGSSSSPTTSDNHSSESELASSSSSGLLYPEPDSETSFCSATASKPQTAPPVPSPPPPQVKPTGKIRSSILGLFDSPKALRSGRGSWR